MISKLLKYYVENYFNKSKDNRRYKYILFYFSLIVILVLILAMLVLVFNNKNISVVIGAFVSIIGLPLGILNIIAERIFPEGEEEYITQIVKIIQETDTENKKINIKASASPQELDE